MTAIGDVFNDDMKGFNDRFQGNTPHSDPVLNPPHYQLLPPYEVIDVREALLQRIPPARYTQAQIDAWSRGWEYATRFMSKDGMQDIEKAINYLWRMRYGEWAPLPKEPKQ